MSTLITGTVRIFRLVVVRGMSFIGPLAGLLAKLRSQLRLVLINVRRALAALPGEVGTVVGHNGVFGVVSGVVSRFGFGTVASVEYLVVHIILVRIAVVGVGEF